MPSQFSKQIEPVVRGWKGRPFSPGSEIGFAEVCVKLVVRGKIPDLAHFAFPNMTAAQDFLSRGRHELVLRVPKPIEASVLSADEARMQISRDNPT